jgi:CBS domain-containing protein
MLLKDVMTKTLQRVSSRDTLMQAAALMRDHDIGMLPVADGETFIGTLTDRDITVRSTAEGRDPAATLVGDIMSTGVVFGYSEDETAKATQSMEKNQVRRLLVLDDQDQCVGVVSLGDIALRGDDPALSEELLEVLSKPAA